MFLRLLLLLSLSTEALGGCNLCADGSDVEKPDFVLDIKEPVPLKTCRDLSNALVFVDAGSDNCFKTQALGRLCGCPVTEGSCSICQGGEEVLKPLQLLEGLIDMSNEEELLGRPTRVERTCGYADSIISQYQSGDQKCLDLPYDDLRRYCGCPGDEEQSNQCTLCPGGEILPTSTDLSTIHFTLNGDLLTCQDAQELADREEQGSFTCSAMQSIASLCGCPSPRENSCRLCSEGETVRHGLKAIMGYANERISCNAFEAQLLNMPSNSSQCLELTRKNETLFAQQCGCSNVEEKFGSCTLCPNGEPPPFLDLKVEEAGGGRTCGVIDNITRALPKESELCATMQLVRKYCGCEPARENSCNLCRGDADMAKPTNKVIFNYGATGDLFDVESIEDIDVGNEYSCALADSAYSALYSENDDWCYWNQLMRGEVCGCSDTSESQALLWTQRFSGSLSLVGSLVIAIYILTKRKSERFMAYNQIVFCISFFDMLSSIAYIIGTSFTPVELGLQGAVGNEATCGFQAWLFQIGFTSVYYNVVLCLYFLFIVKYNWSDWRFRKIDKRVHLTVCTVGVATSFAVIPFAMPDWRWCYLGTPPQSDSWLPGIFLFVVPVASCILAMTIVMFMFVRYVRSAGRGLSVELRVDPRESKIHVLIRRTMWQSFWFLAAFYAVWPIQFAAFLIRTVPSNYWVFLLAAAFGPLQGFLNALVFFFRERKVLHKLFTAWLERRRQRRAVSSEELVDVVSDVAGETGNTGQLQPRSQPWSNAECPRSSSLYADADPLEQNSMDDEIIADDECSNAVLEHAIHTGMLDEAEMALFHQDLAAYEQRN